MSDQGSLGAGASQAQARRMVPTRMVAGMGVALDRLWTGRWPFGEAPVAVQEDALVVRLPGPLRRVGQALTTREPRTTVVDRGDAMVVVAELPGVKKDDLDVSAEGGDLVIRGQRNSASALGMGNRGAQRPSERFYRRITLPEGAAVDRVSAQYADGVLEVTIPKSAAKVKIA